MTNIKIKKTEGAEESMELLAKSIVQVAEGFEAMKKSTLKPDTLYLLLRDMIGNTKITKKQVRLVMEALPRLKSWYVK